MPLNFYQQLNQLADYLEQHLDEELDYRRLAHMIGVNAYTLQRLFPLLANITLADYQRRRRLTLAGKDLAQKHLRVLDVAIKYGYDSAAAFSRAFQKFHGVKPSTVRTQASRLKYYPKLNLTAPKLDVEFNYEIIEFPSFQLFGIKVQTDYTHIKHDAPQLYLDIEQQYPERPHPDYGMVAYDEGRDSSDCYQYWALWERRYTGCKAYRVPRSRWLKFHIASQEAKDIQAISDNFYEKFLPTCAYQLRPDPELEHYHHGTTDLLIPII